MMAAVKSGMSLQQARTGILYIYIYIYIYICIYSVLQCVAVSCCVLLCVAVWCGELL